MWFRAGKRGGCKTCPLHDNSHQCCKEFSEYLSTHDSSVAEKLYQRILRLPDVADAEDRSININPMAFCNNIPV